MYVFMYTCMWMNLESKNSLVFAIKRAWSHARARCFGAYSHTYTQKQKRSRQSQQMHVAFLPSCSSALLWCLLTHTHTHTHKQKHSRQSQQNARPGKRPAPLMVKGNNSAPNKKMREQARSSPTELNNVHKETGTCTCVCIYIYIYIYIYTHIHLCVNFFF
jgi:hypothetical protein